MTEPNTILDASGQPARPPRKAVVDRACPTCGAGADRRCASGGFGTPHPVCVCGYEFMDEVWRG